MSAASMAAKEEHVGPAIYEDILRIPRPPKPVGRVPRAVGFWDLETGVGELSVRLVRSRPTFVGPGNEAGGWSAPGFPGTFRDAGSDTLTRDLVRILLGRDGLPVHLQNHQPILQIMKSPLILPVLGLVGVLSASSAWAQTEAVSNLAEPLLGGAQFDSTGRQAGRFTTGTTINGSVSLYSVILSARNTPTTPGIGLTLELYGDNADPDGGLLIATLTGSDPIGTSYANYTFSAPSGTLLADNTSYWLVAIASSGQFEWAVTGSGAEVGLAGWSISDGHSSGVVGWVSTPDQAAQFAVNVEPVPESSTHAAGALLVGAVGGLWWRQRRSR